MKNNCSLWSCDHRPVKTLALSMPKGTNKDSDFLFMYAKTLIFAVEICESSFATKDNEPPKQTENRTYLGGHFSFYFNT